MRCRALIFWSMTVTWAPIAQEHLRRVGADDTGADHNHFGRGNTRHAAHQDALAAPVVLQQAGRDLGSHGAADLAERAQHRQGSVRKLDLLIGNGSDLLFEHGIDFVAAGGGEMQQPGDGAAWLQPFDLILGRDGRP